MSQPSCDACTELREYAPEFVMNGVTDNVCASLGNNTGLNPALSPRHTNCEDMKDVVDCLIGRKVQELEKLDVCDWKDFMSGFGPNLYETLKAMVCGDCGQWTRIENICNSIDNLLNLIMGGRGAQHYSTPTALIAQKMSGKYFAPGKDDVATDVVVAMYADIKSGAGCNTSRRLARISFAFAPTTPAPSYSNRWHFDIESSLDSGDILGYFRKSDLVPTYVTESRWQDLMVGQGAFGVQSVSGTGRNHALLLVRPRGYIKIGDVEWNSDLKDEYGENVLTVEYYGFVGNASAKSGSWLWGMTQSDVESYYA